MSRAGARTWLLRLALVAGGLLLGLLAAEGAARLWRPPAGGDLLNTATPFGVPQGLYQRHERLQLAPAPGFTGQVLSAGQRVEVQINSLGTRGPEPDPSLRSWLAVGDSFTIALQVHQEQTFTHLLGESLGVQLLNGGVDGYSTWQAAERYRLLDERHDVDGVVLVFFLGNDVTDNQRIADQRKQPGREPPPPPAPPQPGALRLALIRHSVLYTYGQIALRRIALASSDEAERSRLAGELEIFAASGQPSLRAMLAETAPALAQLRDEASRRGDRLLVALAPPLFAVDPSRAEPTLALVGLQDADVHAPRRELLRLLTNLQLPACDLTPALEAVEATGERSYLLLDGHWSPAGHQAVAAALAGCLSTLPEPHRAPAPAAPLDGA